MTKIKLCGLTRPCDIEAANKLNPEYIGFIFAPKSRRYIPPQKALELKKALAPSIQAVGVFVNETPQKIAELLDKGIIDIAQLHGSEDEDYIKTLRILTDKPVVKAFRADKDSNIELWESSSADYILLDSGTGGTGMTFNWNLIKTIKRPYFLAGGLDPHNVQNAIKELNPYGVDVSSGIETDGFKDLNKMADFVSVVRG